MDRDSYNIYPDIIAKSISVLVIVIIICNKKNLIKYMYRFIKFNVHLEVAY